MRGVAAAIRGAPFTSIPRRATSPPRGPGPVQNALAGFLSELSAPDERTVGDEAGRRLLRARPGRRACRRPRPAHSTAPTWRWCWARGWAASPIAWRARAACPTPRCPASRRPPWPATRAAWSRARRGRRRCAVRPRARLRGLPAREVGFGVRVVAALGVSTLIVTNASGGGRAVAGSPGEIVAISDHINLTRRSPLTRPQRRTPGAALRRHDRRVHPGAARAGPGPHGRHGRAAARGDLRRAWRGPRTRRRRRCACCGRWAPAWSGCRPCTR